MFTMSARALVAGAFMLSFPAAFAANTYPQQQQPATQQQVTQQPVTQQPATQQPVAQQPATQQPAPVLTAADIIATWGADAKAVAEGLIAKYGEPAEMTSSMLIWKDVGIWKRTVALKDGVAHNFPSAHVDYLEQALDYKTPVVKFDNIATFDGSVILDRTKGELVVRGDSEEMNLLAVNVANDIAMGTRTVNGAREFLALTAKDFKAGVVSDYTQNLQFSIPKGTDTTDPDVAWVFQTQQIQQTVTQTVVSP